MMVYEFEIPYETVNRIGHKTVNDSIKKLFPHHEEISSEKLVNRQVYGIRVTTQEESPMSHPELLFELQKELRKRITP